MSQENPFAIPREARSKSITFRATPAEYEAMRALAAREEVEIVDLIREGLSLAFEKRQRSAQGRAK